jgi:hypothetical protein
MLISQNFRAPVYTGRVFPLHDVLSDGKLI